MLDFFAGCGRLFNMTFSACFHLDFFKMISFFLLFQTGSGLLRLAISSVRKL